jgi:hypothetical protein
MLNIRTRIRTDLNPSKRIRSQIRSKNIRTVFTPKTEEVADRAARRLGEGLQRTNWASGRASATDRPNEQVLPDTISLPPGGTRPSGVRPCALLLCWGRPRLRCGRPPDLGGAATDRSGRSVQDSVHTLLRATGAGSPEGRNGWQLAP